MLFIPTRETLYATRDRLIKRLDRQRARQQCQAAHQTEMSIQRVTALILKRGW